MSDRIGKIERAVVASRSVEIVTSGEYRGDVSYLLRRLMAAEKVCKESSHYVMTQRWPIEPELTAIDKSLDEWMASK